jgi:glycosyltransferase involved in cell wall biosynthesis
MISLLHPTRNRPQKSVEVTKKWLERAGCDIELIVSIDDNDQYRDRYLREYSTYDPFTTKVISNPNRSAIDAINNAAKESKGDILIVVSDDTDCPDKWCQVIYSAVEGKEDFVLKTFDGAQKWIVTMPVLDRVYYNRFGYIYHPSYEHQFCDTEFTHVADVTGKIIWRNDIEFKHLHYSVLREQKDSLYARNDNTWNEGKKTYIQRFNEQFGLPTTVNIWDIHDNGHYQWLKDAVRNRR